MLIKFRGIIMKKLLFLVLLLLFNFNFLFSGELIFGWNKVNESGGIYDMKFLPGDSTFILGCLGDLNIRSAQTGEVIRSYPVPTYQLEISPDNLRLLSIPIGDTIGKLQLRDINDLHLIKEYVIPGGTDTEGYEFTSSSVYFKHFVIDPVRPYLYAMRYREGYVSGGDWVSIVRIIRYNYQTMQEESIMFTYSNLIELGIRLAISRDGHYLAAISQGESYLRVWDLNTMKLIREFRLYDPYCQDCWCKPQDMKFSEINTENIYFSGTFPKKEDSFDGLIKYNISLDSLIELRYKNDATIRFFMFDNEVRSFLVSYFNNRVYNFHTQETEFEYQRHWPDIGTWGKVIHSKINDLFIGWSGEYFSSGYYNRPSAVNDLGLIDSNLIYPNPTNGIVTIELPAGKVPSSYQITNYEGKLFDLPYKFDGINKYSFDFTTIPSGVYFIKLDIGKELLTYKVIKEY